MVSPEMCELYNIFLKSYNTFASIAASIVDVEGLFVQKVRTYQAAPDGRPDVIEGGLCVVGIG